MMDQDEFVGRIYEIIEKIESHYMFMPINDLLIAQLKNEFIALFEQVGHPERVELQIGINPDDRTSLTMNFFHGNGGIMLKELEQIYNCLVYDNPAGLRLV